MFYGIIRTEPTYCFSKRPCKFSVFQLKFQTRLELLLATLVCRKTDPNGPTKRILIYRSFLHSPLTHWTKVIKVSGQVSTGHLTLNQATGTVFSASLVSCVVVPLGFRRMRFQHKVRTGESCNRFNIALNILQIKYFNMISKITVQFVLENYWVPTHYWKDICI